MQSLKDHLLQYQRADSVAAALKQLGGAIRVSTYRLIYEGQKVNAIMEIRGSSTLIGLKEAKDLADTISERMIRYFEADGFMVPPMQGGPYSIHPRDCRDSVGTEPANTATYTRTLVCIATELREYMQEYFAGSLDMAESQLNRCENCKIPNPVFGRVCEACFNARQSIKLRDQLEQLGVENLSSTPQMFEKLTNGKLLEFAFAFGPAVDIRKIKGDKTFMEVMKEEVLNGGK